MDYTELYHHGVLGQKWGVRRYQNKDGTRTAAGKRHEAELSKDNSERNKQIAKKIAKTALAIGTVAVAAKYVKDHPETVKAITEKAKSINVKDLKTKAIEKGREYVKESIKGAKEGFKEGLHDAPKKAAKAVVTGVVLNATKKALDKSIGKDESSKIFKANDPKQIGKFWKVYEENKEDDK